MRSSIAIALGAAAMCVVWALPGQAASKTRTVYASTGYSNQVCWPSAINPILVVCNGQGAGPGYNTVAYGNTSGPSMSSGYGGGCSKGGY
jgi:hypothetical protein